MDVANPKISVLMSVYNGEKYLSLAIESILNQSFSDFEFIIINDGSKDRSLEIIKSYPDRRIRLIDQPNAGLAASLNKGIGLSKGEYIARMDADDIARSTRLGMQVRFLDANPACAMVGSAVQVIDKEGKNKWIMAHTRTSLETRWSILFDTPFVHSSVMLRRAVLEKTGLYSQQAEFSLVEDYEMWSRLAKKYEVTNLSEILLDYRDNPQGVSHSKRKAQEMQSLAVSAANLSHLIGNPVSLDEARLFRPENFFIPEHRKLDTSSLTEAVETIQQVYRVFCETFSAQMAVEPRTKGKINAQTASILVNLARLLAYRKAYQASLAAFKSAIGMKPGLIFGIQFWKTIAKIILRK